MMIIMTMIVMMIIPNLFWCPAGLLSSLSGSGRPSSSSLFPPCGKYGHHRDDYDLDVDDDDGHLFLLLPLLLPLLHLLLLSTCLLCSHLTHFPTEKKQCFIILICVSSFQWGWMLPSNAWPSLLGWKLAQLSWWWGVMNYDYDCDYDEWLCWLWWLW